MRLLFRGSIGAHSFAAPFSSSFWAHSFPALLCSAERLLKVNPKLAPFSLLLANKRVFIYGYYYSLPKRPETDTDTHRNTLDKLDG